MRGGGELIDSEAAALFREACCLESRTSVDGAPQNRVHRTSAGRKCASRDAPVRFNCPSLPPVTFSRVPRRRRGSGVPANEGGVPVIARPGLRPYPIAADAPVAPTPAKEQDNERDSKTSRGGARDHRSVYVARGSIVLLFRCVQYGVRGSIHLRGRNVPRSAVRVLHAVPNDGAGRRIEMHVRRGTFRPHAGRGRPVLVRLRWRREQLWFRFRRALQSRDRRLGARR